MSTECFHVYFRVQAAIGCIRGEGLGQRLETQEDGESLLCRGNNYLIYKRDTLERYIRKWFTEGNHVPLAPRRGD